MTPRPFRAATLFLPDDGAARPLRLLDSQVTTTGAIPATYETTGS
jgi:hypothetical protein